MLAEWQYLSRAVPGVEGHLQPIEDAIRGKFIPALMGLTGTETVDDDMRALFANSVKQGGLNLRTPWSRRRATARAPSMGALCL